MIFARIQVWTLTLFTALAVSTASAQTLSSLSNQLSNVAGQQVSIAEMGKGKVTIVSFWATWCKPCKEEMKAMQPVYDSLSGKGLQYIAVSIDNTKTMAKVGPYIESQKFTFNVLLDPNKDIFNALNGTDVPFTVVFRADGTMASKHDGYLPGDEVKLKKELEELLNAPKTAAPGQ